MKITGILSIRNGNGLEYPYCSVLCNLSKLCDEVLFGYDPEFFDDCESATEMELPNLTPIESPWDMSFQGHGYEIARQMDILVEKARAGGSDWVVVLQADEAFHPDDFTMLRLFMERSLNTDVTGFSTERLYFWKDLDTVRTDWNANLVRIFKPGHYSFLAEGTSKDGMFSAPILPGQEVALSYKIHHYSRVDSDPSRISKRVRNLDGFFHPPEDLIAFENLPVYDFVPREHDNFSVSGPPKEVEGKFEKFTGTHPTDFEEWYNIWTRS